MTRLRDWFVTSFPAQQQMGNYSAWALSLQSQKENFHLTQVLITLGSLRLQQGRDRNWDVCVHFREVESEGWIETHSWRTKASVWSCDNGAVSFGSPGLSRLGWDLSLGAEMALIFYIFYFFFWSRVRRALQMFPAKGKKKTQTECW